MSHEKNGRVNLAEALDEDTRKPADRFDADGEPASRSKEPLVKKAVRALEEGGSNVQDL